VNKAGITWYPHCIHCAHGSDVVPHAAPCDEAGCVGSTPLAASDAASYPQHDRSDTPTPQHGRMDY
jgi:hypothetical protein